MQIDQQMSQPKSNKLSHLYLFIFYFTKTWLKNNWVYFLNEGSEVNNFFLKVINKQLSDQYSFQEHDRALCKHRTQNVNQLLSRHKISLPVVTMGNIELTIYDEIKKDVH